MLPDGCARGGGQKSRRVPGQGGAVAAGLGAASLAAGPRGAVLPQEPRGVRSVLLVLLGFRQLSLEQHSFPWALLHCAGFGHYRLVSFKRDVDLVFLHFSW